MSHFRHLSVVLATGFIHILPDAITTLSDPCLPESWNVYGAYGGLFAMLAALSMQLIEFLAHQRFHSSNHSHHHDTEKPDIEQVVAEEKIGNKSIESIEQKEKNNLTNEAPSMEYTNHADTNSEKRTEINDTVDDTKSTKSITDIIEDPERLERGLENFGKIVANNPIDDGTDIRSIHHHSDILDKSNPSIVMAIDVSNSEATSGTVDICEMPAHCHGAAFYDDGRNTKISTYLLEFGIALHSILIGLTLGTTTESFVALFIALSFHQFFEAIALGAQIARTKKISIRSAMFMVIFFSLTTPVGIAIGIGIHSGTYNPKSVSSLLVTGILDSLSAGILIYVALVNLITADMGVHASEFYALSTKLKFLYFIALYLGAAVMAIIGRWA